MNYRPRIDATGPVRPVVADGPHRIEQTSPVSNLQYTIFLEALSGRSVLIGAQPSQGDPKQEAEGNPSQVAAYLVWPE